MEPLYVLEILVELVSYCFLKQASSHEQSRAAREQLVAEDALAAQAHQRSAEAGSDTGVVAGDGVQMSKQLVVDKIRLTAKVDQAVLSVRNAEARLEEQQTAVSAKLELLGGKESQAHTAAEGKRELGALLATAKEYLAAAATKAEELRGKLLTATSLATMEEVRSGLMEVVKSLSKGAVKEYGDRVRSTNLACVQCLRKDASQSQDTKRRKVAEVVKQPMHLAMDGFQVVHNCTSS